MALAVLVHAIGEVAQAPILAFLDLAPLVGDQLGKAVGQFENSLMPWRTEGSARTSMPLNLTPRWLRICTTAAEKPHCGKTGVPFMKSTTGASPICWRMRSCKVMSICLDPRFSGAAAG